jgi:hypothetical protein
MIPITKQHFENEAHPVSLHTAHSYCTDDKFVLLVACGRDYYMFKDTKRWGNEYYKLTEAEYNAKLQELKNGVIY